MTDHLAGKVVLITGGNSGIGKETGVALAAQGAHVIIAARNPSKARAAVKEIQERTHAGERVTTLPLDLASFASVRECANQFVAEHDRLDILVNNAGVVLHRRQVSADGHEMQFQVNHLGHFLLTQLLLDRLAAAGKARVVNVSSAAQGFVRGGLRFDDLEWEHRRYRGFAVYCATKLMNVLFTRELAKRVDDGITANAVHPGYVASNFAREGDTGVFGRIAMPLGRPFAISAEKGARTSVYVASSPEVEGISGAYFAKSRATQPSKEALDDAAAARLWDVSAALTAS